MNAQIRIIDSAFLDRLCDEAAAAPRRRKNANLHTDGTYPCHRLFNALRTGTYVRPHCHAEACKDETVVVLRGRLGLLEFDAAGEVKAAVTLLPGMTADVPHGVFHTFCCLEDPSIFFEAKAGPYLPPTDAERAPFAPAEDDPRAADYLAHLLTFFP